MYYLQVSSKAVNNLSTRDVGVSFRRWQIDNVILWNSFIFSNNDIALKLCFYKSSNSKRKLQQTFIGFTASCTLNLYYCSCGNPCFLSYLYQRYPEFNYNSKCDFCAADLIHYTNSSKRKNCKITYKTYFYIRQIEFSTFI